MEGILTMSQKEADRISVIEQVGKKKLTVEEASELIGLSQRHTYRVLKRIRDEGLKIIKPSKDHPFRKMNQRLKDDGRRNFLRSALG